MRLYLGFLVKIISIRGDQRNLYEMCEDGLNDELSTFFINKIDIITYVYKFENLNKYNIYVKHKNTTIFYEDEFEILYNEPAHNLLLFI